MPFAPAGDAGSFTNPTGSPTDYGPTVAGTYNAVVVVTDSSARTGADDTGAMTVNATVPPTACNATDQNFDLVLSNDGFGGKTSSYGGHELRVSTWGSTYGAGRDYRNYSYTYDWTTPGAYADGGFYPVQGGDFFPTDQIEDTDSPFAAQACTAPGECKVCVTMTDRETGGTEQAELTTVVLDYLDTYCVAPTSPGTLLSDWQAVGCPLQSGDPQTDPQFVVSASLSAAESAYAATGRRLFATSGTYTYSDRFNPPDFDYVVEGNGRANTIVDRPSTGLATLEPGITRANQAKYRSLAFRGPAAGAAISNTLLAGSRTFFYDVLATNFYGFVNTGGDGQQPGGEPPAGKSHVHVWGSSFIRLSGGPTYNTRGGNGLYINGFFHSFAGSYIEDEDPNPGSEHHVRLQAGDDAWIAFSDILQWPQTKTGITIRGRVTNAQTTTLYAWNKRITVLGNFLDQKNQPGTGVAIALNPQSNDYDCEAREDIIIERNLITDTVANSSTVASNGWIRLAGPNRRITVSRNGIDASLSNASGGQACNGSNGCITATRTGGFGDCSDAQLPTDSANAWDSDFRHNVVRVTGDEYSPNVGGRSDGLENRVANTIVWSTTGGAAQPCANGTAACDAQSNEYQPAAGASAGGIGTTSDPGFAGPWPATSLKAFRVTTPQPGLDMSTFAPEDKVLKDIDGNAFTGNAGVSQN